MIDFTSRKDLIKAGIIVEDGPWNPKKPLNRFQRESLAGTFDLRMPIQQPNGQLPLPPMVVQWKGGKT